MNRSKTVFACLLIFLVFFSVEAWAGELVWGPKKYVRDTGKPYVVIDSFTIENPKGKYWLQISNGEGVQKPGADVGVVEMRNMVSSAIIWINGEKVVTPNDFNQEVYGFTKDITLMATNTIEVEVRGIPKSFITVEIREAELNPTVENRDNDLWGGNEGDGIFLAWEEDDMASEYIVYRAYSINGPWEDLQFRRPKHRPNAVDYTSEAKLRDLCYRIEAIDEKGNVVRHYEPICVPKYEEKQKQSFNEQESLDSYYAAKINEIQKGLNKPLLLLASLSPMVPTDPRANKLCLSDTELTKFDAMDLSQIYKFLKDKNSFLSMPLKDVNGDLIDPYQIIYDAAQKSKINPQVILTIMEREQPGSITKPTRLKDRALRRLMGWDPKDLIVPLAEKSIQEQIRDGVAQLRRDYNRLTSIPPKPTPGGWQVGVEKMTDDGVLVTPETVTAALMYAYNTEVGEGWGGGKGIGGNARFCKFWKEFGFASTCPSEPAPLTITGTETITRNSSAQYTATGCPNNVEWSVSGTGATISSTGLLTAGATSCGSLTVTATCSACGTSATQDVRVANSGSWRLISDVAPPPECTFGWSRCCWNCLGPGTVVEVRGRYKYIDDYNDVWNHVDCPYSPLCVNPSCFPALNTLRPPADCSSITGLNLDYVGQVIWRQRIYEWECL